MLNEYGYIAILLAFAVLFPSLPLSISFLFRKLNIRPEAPDPVKMRHLRVWRRDRGR